MATRRAVRSLLERGEVVGEVSNGSWIFLCEIVDDGRAWAMGFDLSKDDAMYIVLTEHGYGWLRWWNPAGYYGSHAEFLFE